MQTITTGKKMSNDVALSTADPDEQHPTPALNEKGAGQAKRKRLVELLRGYFATPVIAALGEIGMTGKMMEGDFAVSDWSETPRPDIVAALFNYLHSIGLLVKRPSGMYALTPEGRTAIDRNGAFSLLMSYAEYFHQLPNALSGADVNPAVNRSRNVRGSGQLHGKKFFPEALQLLTSEPPSALIDIGCGDGCFMDHARQMWRSLPVFGVDLSETAVETTKRRLHVLNSSDLTAVVARGQDIAVWNKAVPELIRDSPRLVISLWFVAHEFSNGSAENIHEFFSTLRQTFPRARVILGEISKVPAEYLVEDHDLSIMPEFLLFHELSRQGVLPWSTWQQIRSTIPYTLKTERRFDEVRSSSGEPIPASFLWLFQPA